VLGAGARLRGAAHAPMQWLRGERAAARVAQRRSATARRSSEYAAAKEAFDALAGRQAAVLAQLRPAALAAALAARADAAEAAGDALCAARRPFACALSAPGSLVAPVHRSGAR